MDNKDWKREMRNIENEANQPRRNRNDASQRKYNPSYRPNFDNIPHTPYEEPPAPSPAHQSTSLVNPGWMALGFLIASLVVGYNAIAMMGNAMTNMLCQQNSPEINMQTGATLIALSVIGFIISIAAAGAGIATRRGIITSWLVIVVFVLPIVYFIGQILFDLPELSSILPLSGSSNATTLAEMCN